MGIKSYIKKTAKNNTNVSEWASWHSVKNSGKNVAGLFKDIGESEASEYVADSFEDAMKHYGLSESDLKTRMQTHFRTAVMCALFGLFALMWTAYLLIKLMFLSALVAAGLAVLMLSYAFREHFYYFKIKCRNLNITPAQWLRAFISAKRQK